MDRHAGTINRDIQILFSSGLVEDLPDAELLSRFVDSRDDVAFEALMRRHGPMVLGVCRRILRDPHDADDAFQATFMILARKAGSVSPRAMVAGWLYGVAYRTALKAAAMVTRQKVREVPLAGAPEPESPLPSPHEEWMPLLDEELSRLPEKYRTAIGLCFLEGRSYRDAASYLGWPEGTLSGRLSRAKTLLAGRLTRRGVTLSAGTLAALGPQSSASAFVPASLLVSTARTACLAAAGETLVAGKIATLTQGMLTSMLIKKLLMNAAVIAGLAGAVGLAAGPALFGQQRAPTVSKEPLLSFPIEAGPAPTPGIIRPAPKPRPLEAVDYSIKWSISEAGQEVRGPGVMCGSGNPILMSSSGAMVDNPSGGAIPIGLTFSTTLIPAKDDKVWVDIRADYQLTVENPSDDELRPRGKSMRIRGKTLRFIQAVKLGETLTVEIDPAKSARLKLTITQTGH